MLAVSVTLGSASSVASLSSGVQSVRLTLIVHAGELGYKIYCISNWICLVETLTNVSVKMDSAITLSGSVTKLLTAKR